jgi:hypothetical protein
MNWSLSVEAGAGGTAAVVVGGAERLLLLLFPLLLFSIEEKLEEEAVDGVETALMKGWPDRDGGGTFSRRMEMAMGPRASSMPNQFWWSEKGEKGFGQKTCIVLSRHCFHRLSNNICLSLSLITWSA